MKKFFKKIVEFFVGPEQPEAVTKHAEPIKPIVMERDK